jgi:chaperonin GroES
MSVEKLLKFVQADNVAELLDECDLKKIVEDATHGFDIDEDSCKDWIDMNKEAVKMIKAETRTEVTHNYAHSKVIYPLLASATIQLASRLIPHLVRNNRVAECAVLGPDPDGRKEDKAQQVGDFFSYDLLIDSDSWLKESHKLLQMLCAWGVGYRKLRYDKDLDKVLSDVLNPEDVFINANTSCIDKSRRITIRNYMTKNQIVELIRADKFCDVDLDKLKAGNEDGQDPKDTNPVYIILEQFCYIDLDDDGYEEPYVVYFHRDSCEVLGIYCGYEEEDIHVNAKGKIKKIIPRPYIVDYHCIDDPEGKFHSMGLNHLLFHQNKSITSILRQLIDSGTLANQQGGFTTKAFKSKKREIKQQLGQFTQLEIPPNVDIRSQIMALPFKEPSQVLFSLLGLLIQAGKETGFVTEALMGNAEGQNVPATTMLALIEQGTRAFKPMVQKLFHSLKKEFKMMFHLYGKSTTFERFIKFQNVNINISHDIFNEQELDIMPVADPTQSSEAHKFIKVQALENMLNGPLAQVLNLHALAARIFKDLNIERPQELINPIQPPQPPPPDPKMIEVQLNHQVDMAKQQLAVTQEHRQAILAQNELIKTKIKENELILKSQEVQAKDKEREANANRVQQQMHTDRVDIYTKAQNQNRLAKVAEDALDVERRKVELLAQQRRDKNSDSSS